MNGQIHSLLSIAKMNLAPGPVPETAPAPALSSEEDSIFSSTDTDDTDSAYADDDEYASTTISLTDSIRDYRILHGRTYHKFGDTEYWGPNDETQNEQLDIGHHMLTLLLDGKIFLAPINPNPQEVIDIGTGTGIWAIDFADAYPSAEVIGTDLSPIQPLFVPPNCRFELSDAQLPWAYQSSTFDFVHISCLFGSISDWQALYAQAFSLVSLTELRCTKPGGWFEDLEMTIQFKSDDPPLPEDHIMARWSKVFLEAGELMGKTFRIAEMSRDLIMKAGFVDVVQKRFKLPVGDFMDVPKMKEIGRWNLLYTVQGLEGWALMLLSKVMKWEYTEIQAFIGLMRSACLRRKNRAYFEVVVVYGRKPEIELMIPTQT